jgi:hypothetical protein
MTEKAPIQDQFRKLQVELPPVRKENSLFWWLAGIALAVCFLTITVHYYTAHRKGHTSTLIDKPLYKNAR